MSSLFCGRPTKKPGRLCRWRINTERVCEAHGTMVDEAVPLRAILAREALMRPPEPPPATGEWIASKPAAVADAYSSDFIQPIRMFKKEAGKAAASEGPKRTFLVR